MARTSVTALLAAIAFVSLLSLAVPTRGGDGSVVPRPAHTFGDQRFPPSNLSHEGEASALAAWINGALGLNATQGPTRTHLPYGGDRLFFFDAFNETVPVPVNGSDFRDPSGSLLTLYYASPTGEFVGFEVRHDPPRPIDAAGLRAYTTSLAASFGVSLANASYVEYSTIYRIEDDPNGTGQIVWATRYGIWRETDAGVPVHLANQLSVAEDVGTHSLRLIRAFRWMSDVPTLRYTIDKVLAEAVRAVHQPTGRWTFAGGRMGVLPNYWNLTWSFLATLTYETHMEWEAVGVFLEAESLAFQGIAYRVLTVADGEGPVVLAAVAVVAAVGIASAAVVLVWSGVRSHRHSRSQYGGGRNR